MNEFKELILRYIFDVEDVKDVPRYELSEQDWKNIHQISRERYQGWDWNYGKSPSFNFIESYKLPCGLVDVRLYVNKGMFVICILFVDILGCGDVQVLEE